MLLNEFQMEHFNANENRDNTEEEGEELAREINNGNTTLQKAKAHTKRYQTQRETSNQFIDLPRLDIASHLPSLFRLYFPNIEGE